MSEWLCPECGQSIKPVLRINADPVHKEALEAAFAWSCALKGTLVSINLFLQDDAGLAKIMLEEELE